MNDKFIKVKALITLKETEKGGRYKPIESGYRPNHIFEYKFPLKTYIGEILHPYDLIYPGQSKICIVKFNYTDSIIKHLKINNVWFLNEGLKTIGNCVILSV